ncbi:MAG TPA: ribosome-binding factor A [Geobacteraceae bacterium]|nr:ribosome-binding factor A [Geobacteraceae bacterium]
MSIKRSDKVAEAIHEIVSGLLVKGVKDPRIGFTTVTGVKVTDDLHLATVYFTVVGDDSAKRDTEQGLNSARGFIRKEMGKTLRMRYVPDIIFKYDESVEYGRRIDSLLDEVLATKTDNDNENNP